MTSDAEFRCGCGEWLESVSYDTTEGVRVLPRPVEVPVQCFCVAGHLSERWMTITDATAFLLAHAEASKA